MDINSCYFQISCCYTPSILPGQALRHPLHLAGPLPALSSPAAGVCRLLHDSAVLSSHADNAVWAHARPADGPGGLLGVPADAGGDSDVHAEDADEQQRASRGEDNGAVATMMTWVDARVTMETLTSRSIDQVFSLACFAEAYRPRAHLRLDPKL